MKLLTVKEYAQSVKKSIPLIYKRIAQGKLPIEKRYGLILIKTYQHEAKQGKTRGTAAKKDS